MAVSDIIVDYLVVGAGIGGLSFVDELLTRSSTSTILIVDKRELPGGH
jgi:cation diffusion facilitator CzcD-associated flavoprotein CzcO